MILIIVYVHTVYINTIVLCKIHHQALTPKGIAQLFYLRNVGFRIYHSIFITIEKKIKKKDILNSKALRDNG